MQLVTLSAMGAVEQATLSVRLVRLASTRWKGRAPPVLRPVPIMPPITTSMGQSVSNAIPNVQHAVPLLLSTVLLASIKRSLIHLLKILPIAFPLVGLVSIQMD